MINLNSIRANLIQAIKNSGVKQKDLAKSIGVCHQAIGQYLSGRAMPALDKFANICSILDLDTNEILCVSSDLTNVKFIKAVEQPPYYQQIFNSLDDVSKSRVIGYMEAILAQSSSTIHTKQA